MDVLALFVEQERGDIHRNLGVHAPVVSFIASSWMMRKMCNADEAVSRIWPTPWQRGQGQLDSDSAGCRRWRELHQTETRNFSGLHARAVVAERIAQAVFHFALILARFHVDEVDDHQAAQVAQTQLAGDFIRPLRQLVRNAVSSMSLPWWRARS